MDRNIAPTSSGLFVTGTDTDVGKTFVAAAILRHLVNAGTTAGAYKPVASGVRGGDPLSGDPGILWRAAGGPLRVQDVCPQVFRPALSPPAAARAEGKRVDDRLLRDGIRPWRERGGCVVVEGAGGLFSPLSESTLNVDLVRDLGFPVVIVDSGGLGGIGRVLATHRAAVAEGVRPAAVVLSHVRPFDASPADETTFGLPAAEATREEIARHLFPLPVLLLRHGAVSIEPDVDWASLGS